MTDTSAASALVGTRTSPLTACRLTLAGLAGLVAQARADLGTPQLIVTGSHEAAVAAREQLAPTRYFDDSGLPLSARNQGAFALLLAQAPAHERRMLLNRFQQGALSGLVLAASDLAAPGMLDALAQAGGPWTWRVLDATGLLVESPVFQPALLVLQDALALGLVSKLELFTAHPPAALQQGIAQRFGLTEVTVVQPDLPVSPVRLETVLREGLLSSRTVLTEALRQLLATSEASELPRALLVTPGATSGHASLPTEELFSLAQELGFSPQGLLPEDAEGTVELWAERARHALVEAGGLALASQGELLHGFMPGGALLMLRLQPPDSLERIREEHSMLRHLGGGTWAALLEPGAEPPPLPSTPLIRVLAEQVLTLAGSGRRVVVDVESLLPALKAELPELPERVADAGRLIRQALDLLVGVGLFSSSRVVHSLLEVAEAHRFASPHIDIDPRYTLLKQRYDAALAGMGLLEAIGHKLNARGRRDLRILAPRLGYSVAELNVLFADLAREGLLLARGVTSGLDPANLDLELELRDDADALRTRLPALLEGVEVALTWRYRARAAAKAFCAAPSQEGLEASQAGVSLSDVAQADLAAAQVSGTSPRLEGVREAAPASIPGVEASQAGVSATPATARGRQAETVSASPKGAWASGDFSADRLGVLFRHVMASPLTTGRVRQLRASLAEASGQTAPVASYLLSLLEGETLQAGQCLLEMLQQTPALPGLDDVLPALLNALELRAGANEGGPLPLSDELEPWRTLLLLIPALEEISATEQTQLLKLVEPSYPVQLSGLGSLTLTLGPSESLPTKLSLELERQALEPELEAAIWLAVDRRLMEGVKSRDSRIPACLIRARLAEVYRLLEGISADPVLEPLRIRILDEACHGAWMGEARHTVAVALARQQAGQSEAALELLRALSPEQRGTLEVTRLEVQLELSLNEPLKALQRLESAAHDVKKGLGQSTWQKLVSALQGVCAAQEACAGCTLGCTSFCPAGDGLLELQEQNPFQEGRKPLQLRLDKRGKAGFQPSDPARLLALLSRYGTGFSPQTLTHWMQSTRDARPEVSLQLAQHAFDNGAGDAALLGLDEALAHRDPGQPGAISLLTGGFKLYLGLGRLGDALRLAEELLELGQTTGRAARELANLLTDLDSRLTPGWQDRLEAHSEGLAEPARQTLARLAEKRAHKERLSTARARLERSVRQGQWKELVEGMSALSTLLGDGAASDPLLLDAKKRLDERARKVEARLKTLLKGEIDPRGAKLELDKLGTEAPLLGLESLLAETTAQVEQRLAQLPPPGSESPPKSTTSERTTDLPAGDSTPTAPREERPASPRTESSREEHRRPEQRTDDRRRDGSRPPEGRPSDRRPSDRRPSEGRPQELRPDDRRREGTRPGPSRNEQPRQEQGRPTGGAAEGPRHEQGSSSAGQAPQPARADRHPSARPAQDAVRGGGGPGSGGERRPDSGSRRGGPPEGGRSEPGRQEGRERGGDRRPSSGRPGDAGRGEGARNDAPRAEAPVPRLEGPALLEGLKAAQGDRDRARLVMAVLPEALSADAEKGIRLVRDTLPTFERVGAMDQALARLVREGQVPDASLARFKRVLEKFHAGHHLTVTFEAISTREAPEAWKVALSQLKLGGKGV